MRSTSTIKPPARPTHCGVDFVHDQPDCHRSGLLWAPGRFGVEGVTSIVELLKPHPRSVKAANCLSLDEFEESRSCIFRRYIRPIVTDFLQYSDLLVLGESEEHLRVAAL